jgi:hypothetical protein
MEPEGSLKEWAHLQAHQIQHDFELSEIRLIEEKKL